jgi:L-lactate dehydrogenase complex protein LldG
MKASGQEHFIQRIQAALNKPAHVPADVSDLFPDQPSEGDLQLLSAIQNRNEEDRRRLLQKLIRQAEPIQLVVITCKDWRSATDHILRLTLEKKPEWGNRKSVCAWEHPLLDNLNLTAALAEYDIPVHITCSTSDDASQRDRQRSHIIESFMGVTSADFCMADTATLVLRNRPGQPRAVSLVPSIHVAVIEKDQIIGGLKELYLVLKWDAKEKQEGLTNCMTFISGPSKTADIEATMVHGAHGPREVYLFVLMGKNQTPESQATI